MHGAIVLLCLFLCKNVAATLPETLNIAVLPNNGEECPTETELNTARSELDTNILTIITNDVLPNYVGASHDNPATSCSNLPPGSPSGTYWIRNTIAGNTATQQYCDMTRSSCCDTIGGWMRVADLDMTDPSEQCPPALVLRDFNGRRLCGRPDDTIGCESIIYPLNGIEYQKVCGRVIGYQFNSPDGFNSYIGDQFDSTYNNTLDGLYVDGVSITHGLPPRDHIWTFVGVLDGGEGLEGRTVVRCPCTRTADNYTAPLPPYINNDYFCDTGINGEWIPSYVLYPNNPLWDGQGCDPASSCCSFNSPPYFCNTLPQPTTDDIEVRVCADQIVSDEDTPLEIIEIYVQ